MVVIGSENRTSHPYTCSGVEDDPFDTPARCMYARMEVISSRGARADVMEPSGVGYVCAPVRTVGADSQVVGRELRVTN